MLANEAESPRGLQAGETVLGRYRIESEVGSGGMGTVYAATHLVTGREVALKCIHGSHPVRRERALREARSLGKVRHPRVVEIVDAGEEGAWLYLVMEMLRGRTLKQHAASKLSVEDATRITLMALEGVQAAHSSGILHRDLKLSNIFCCLSSSTNQVENVKLLDFGIARSLTGEEPTITGSRDLVGSPIFMAPEQLLGEPLTERTDVYAMGVVLYALLAGRLPFQAGTAISVGMQIVQGSLPALSSLRPDVNEELSLVVSRAMALAPAERFASAEAFSSALLAARDRNGKISKSGELESPSHADPRHHTPFILSVLFTVAFLLAGVVWILLYAP